jgi:hypothetical protein
MLDLMSYILPLFIYQVISGRLWPIVRHHKVNHTHTHTHKQMPDWMIGWLVNYLPKYLTNYKKQSPSSEANSWSASQKNPCILWNSMLICFHNANGPCREPNALDHTILYYFFQINLNIRVPPTSSLQIYETKLYAYISPLLCMPRAIPPSHPSILDHPSHIWCSVQITKFLIMQISPAQHHSS